MRTCTCALVVLFSCGGVTDTSSGNFACAYEEQKSQKCGAAPSGAYEQKCFDVEKGSPAYEQRCGTIETSDTHCGGGCCLEFSARNIRFLTGDCAENGLTAL